MQKPGMGVLRSKEDYRYVNIEHLAGAPAEASTYPDDISIDYSQIPDLYQRKIGACTNHGAVEVVMHRELRQKGVLELLSPRMSYALSKIEDGIGDLAEQGTFCNMPFKIGVKYGFASDAVVPNDTTLDFNAYIFNRDIKNMPKEAFEDAAKHRIPGYVQVGKWANVTHADLKRALTIGQDGVAILIQVGEEFWTAKDGRTSWAASDLLPIRKCVNAVSGHLITVTRVQVEQETGRLKVHFRNHWSKFWADNDNGWFYYDEHPILEAWMPSEIPDPLLAIIKSLPKQEDFRYQWTKDLDFGAQGEDVRNLQIALKIVGTFPFNQPVTNYYGDVTRRAVVKFQVQYKVATPAEITAAAGKFGPKSREALNRIFLRK